MKTLLATLLLTLCNLPAQTTGDYQFARKTADGWEAKTITPEAGKLLSWDGSGNPVNLAPTTAATWGSLTGTLADQTDLQAALDAKQNSLVGDSESNAAVVAAITDDPAAVRDAAGLGTSATKDLGSLVFPGPYADNLAAIIAGDVAKDSAYRKLNGEIGWLKLTEEAAAYQEVTGISDDAAVKLSGFFEGLEAIGIKDNLLDGAIYKAQYQPESGVTGPSLLGLSNATWTGSPTRMHGGMYFNGVDQYGQAPIPTSTGSRTFAAMHSGFLANTDTATRPILQLLNTAGTHSCAIYNNGTTYGYAVSYGGGAARQTTGDPGWSRNKLYLQNCMVSDDAAAGASSFSVLRAPLGGLTTYTRRSTQGEASYTLNKLRICMNATAAGTPIYTPIERLIPGWLLFDIALNDIQQGDLAGLLAQTVFPAWRIIWEGDSISNFIQGVAGDKGYFAGANVQWYNRALSGDTSTNGISQLGTSTGLEDAILDGAVPTVVELSYGQNDLGLTSDTPAAIHARLRTLWAYVKTRGATVAARTVMQASNVYTTSREADRVTLNTLIRADEGIYYDILVDLDQWCLDFTDVRPYYDEPLLFNPDDPILVHPRLDVGMGANLMGEWISEVLYNKGGIPQL